MTCMVNYDSKSKMIFYFLRGNKRYFLLSVAFACLVSLLDLINPKIIEYTVDCVIGDQKATGVVNGIIEYMGGYTWLHHHLVYIACLVVLIALLAGICRYLFTLFNSMGAEHLVKRMRDQLFEHIMYLPYSWHIQNHTGDIIQRCTSDVETVKVFVSEQLTQLFRVVLMIGLSMYFMITIHFGLAMVAAFLFPLS